MAQWSKPSQISAEQWCWIGQWGNCIVDEKAGISFYLGTGTTSYAVISADTTFHYNSIEIKHHYTAFLQY